MSAKIVLSSHGNFSFARWVTVAVPVSFAAMRAQGDPRHPRHPTAVADAAEPCNSAVERPFVAPWFQFRHPFTFEWNIARLSVPSLAPQLEGLRVLHLTDLHLRKRWSGTYDELIRRLKADTPDLLLFTGDFVDNKRNHDPALPNLYRILDAFHARLGCYAILGNHDTYRLKPRLRNTNVRLLDGERELLDVDGATVELIGLPGVARKDLSPELAASIPDRETMPPGALRVVLSHFPDHLRRTERLRPDLFLAGHTHGGQVCLPGMVPIIKHDSLPRRLCSGVNRVGGTWLVVNRGLGYTGLPLRVFCPPEVIEIRLRRGSTEC